MLGDRRCMDPMAAMAPLPPIIREPELTRREPQYGDRMEALRRGVRTTPPRALTRRVTRPRIRTAVGGKVWSQTAATGLAADMSRPAAARSRRGRPRRAAPGSRSREPAATRAILRRAAV